jgi:class 3 adenylate cyclase
VFNGTWLFTVISLVGIGAYCLDPTLRVAWLRQIDLTAAEERIRVLLHNILPPPIAARKLREEVVIADSFSAASLLFADIVGFTELSAKMAPTDVVGLLNDLLLVLIVLLRAMGSKRSRQSAIVTWSRQGFRMQTRSISRN